MRSSGPNDRLRHPAGLLDKVDETGLAAGRRVTLRLAAAFGWRLEPRALAALADRVAEEAAAALASTTTPPLAQGEMGSAFRDRFSAGQEVGAEHLRAGEQAQPYGGQMLRPNAPPRPGIPTLERMELADGGPASEALEPWLEHLACRLHFAELYDALCAGGEARRLALAELFEPQWEGPAGECVRYTGYAFRAALATLRRATRRSRHQPDGAAGRPPGEPAPEVLIELAADAAARAVANVQAKLAACRSRDSFWGWLARTVERAALEELRLAERWRRQAARQTALPRDDSPEPPARAGDEGQIVDLLTLRGELLHKLECGRLRPHHLAVLVATFWEGLPAAAIAARLTERAAADAAPTLPAPVSPVSPAPPVSPVSPVSPAQVSQWKHRALRVLRQNLEEIGFPL